MPSFRNFQTNFSGGLLSEGMRGRVDLAQYENGCLQLKNCWPKVAGGLRRRPGSVYLNTLQDDGVRIEPFVFNETQIYLVCISAGSGIEILDPDTGEIYYTNAGPFTGTTPTDDEIREFSITQAADFMFIASGVEQIMTIQRTSATTFTMGQMSWEARPETSSLGYNCPFIKYADSDVTMTVDEYLEGAGATVTLSAAHFDNPGHLQRLLRYRGKQMYVTSVLTSTTATVTILEELDRGQTLTLTVADDNPMDFELDEFVVGESSGAQGQVISRTTTTITLSMIAGFFPAASTEVINGLTSETKATITAVASSDPPAVSDWDEEAFTDYWGWPTVIEFHAQRLWLAGSPSLPAHIFGSRVAAFFNFDVGDGFPADSIQAVIAGKQINQINNIVSGRHLQVFCDSAEFYAPQSEDLPLVPETFDLLKQTAYGSKKSIQPKVFDESTLFVMSRGNAVREFIWVDRQRGYSSDAVSLIAEEYLSNTLECEVLYGGYDRPEQIAFFVNSNGTIAYYHSARAEGIRSWGIWDTQGTYKSVCALTDTLYAIVEREINGNTVSFVERFELYQTVDAGITKVSPALAPVTGFTAHALHLANTEVEYVVSANPDGSGDAGGPQVSDQELSADYYLGSNTLGVDGDSDFVNFGVASVTNLTVGLAYSQVVETMPIEVKDQQGVTSGMPKRIVSADVYMASTLSIQLQGYDVLTIVSAIDLDADTAPITGNRKFYLLGYSERPTLTITNAIPLPCEILAVSGEVEY